MLARRGVDASSAAAGVVDDLALLGRCDAYVGKFTSNLDRIAYALMSAREFVAVNPEWACPIVYARDAMRASHVRI